MTAKSSPVRMLCIYRVKEGREDEFRTLLDKHWPTLRSAGLASEKPARWFRGAAKDGKTRFIELFEWKDDEASGVAHQSPAVMSIWEPMGALAEGMEFIELETAIA
jgi:quinol monooxygenase YgiN